jgi:hypothetical protein
MEFTTEARRTRRDGRNPDQCAGARKEQKVQGGRREKTILDLRGQGDSKCELRGLEFLDVVESEKVGFSLKILVKSDGKIAGFVGLISVLAARCW